MSSKESAKLLLKIKQSSDKASHLLYSLKRFNVRSQSEQNERDELLKRHGTSMQSVLKFLEKNIHQLEAISEEDSFASSSENTSHD
jgi:hypothetical protein